MNIEQLKKEVARLRNVEGDLEGAISLLEDNSNLIDEKSKPAFLMAQATLYSDVGRNDRAVETSELALKLARKAKDDWVEANVSRRLGWVIWSTKQDKEKAIKLIKRALQITDKHKDDKKFQKVAASAWAAIGNVECDLGNNSKALAVFEKSLKLARETGYVEREATVLGDIGHIFLSTKEFDKAEEVLVQAEKIGREKYRHELPAALLRLGHVYYYKDSPKRNPKIAEKYFLESLSIAIKDGWKRDQADAKFALAEVMRDRGNKSKAKDLCRESINVYQEIGMPKKVKDVNRFLKKL
jgi:tetratricopeptide (TPR) repeat protein